MTRREKRRRPDEEGPSALHLALGAAAAAALTAAVFWPALSAGFVNWDDDFNILKNEAFRGFGWTQLKWMFTTCFLGPYQPLSWLSYALDFKLWGLDPFGYHLTNVLFHSANAAAFFLLSRELLRRLDREATAPPRALSAAALFSALVFAVHPLRAESVAWVTERRDVVSGVFYWLSLWLYLRSAGTSESPAGDGPARPEARLPAGTSPPGGRPSWLSRLGPSLACFVLALLGKGTTMTLPAALLILDIFPLGRLSWDPRRWLEPAARSSLVEKIPFFAAALAAGAVGYVGQQATGTALGLADWSMDKRLSHVFYGLAFYLQKTLWPSGLHALYEARHPITLANPVYWVPALAVLGITGLVVLRRRAWPAGPALWAYYAATLFPVSGVVKFGQHVAADRYSYLACGGWAVLAGAVLLRGLSGGREKRHVSALAASLLFLALGQATVAQVRTWHDSESLWRRATSLDPAHNFGRNNLGTTLADKGDLEEAIEQYRVALRIKDDGPFPHHNWGQALARLGRLEEAVVKYRDALVRDQYYAPSRRSLAYCLRSLGRPAEAAAELQRLLEREPGKLDLLAELGDIQLEAGRLKDAEASYRSVVSAEPSNLAVQVNLATLLSKTGRLKEALEGYRQTEIVHPKEPQVQLAWGNALLEAGRPGEAIERYRKALSLGPNLAAAHNNLGTALFRLGKNEESVEEYRKALAINPAYPDARRNLANTLLRLNRPREAEAEYRELLRLNPSDEGARRALQALAGR